MSEDFAKEFRVNGKQLLAVQHEIEGDPVVQWFYQPRGMGVGSITVAFDGDQEGWSKCFAYLEASNQTEAERIAATFESFTDEIT